MATVAKGELAGLVADHAGISTAESARLIGEILDCISEALQRGDSVRLTGFGTFRVTDRSERRGHDPRTGEVLTIPAGRRVLFTPGSRLRHCVLARANGHEEGCGHDGPAR